MAESVSTGYYPHASTLSSEPLFIGQSEPAISSPEVEFLREFNEFSVTVNATVQSRCSAELHRFRSLRIFELLK